MRRSRYKDMRYFLVYRPTDLRNGESVQKAEHDVVAIRTKDQRRFMPR